MTAQKKYMGLTLEQLDGLDNDQYTQLYCLYNRRSYVPTLLANALLVQANKAAQGRRMSMHHAVNLCKFRIKKARASGIGFFDALRYQTDHLARVANKGAYTRQLSSVDLHTTVIQGTEDQALSDVLDRMDFDTQIERLKKQELQALANFLRIQQIADRQDAKANITAANGKLKVTNLQKTHTQLSQRVKYIANKYFGCTQEGLTNACYRYGFLVN